MNRFDAVVYAGLVVAVVTGFNAGLLRSAVTILAYLFAMPIAVWAMSLVSPGSTGQPGSLWRRIRCCSSEPFSRSGSCWAN